MARIFASNLLWVIENRLKINQFKSFNLFQGFQIFKHMVTVPLSSYEAYTGSSICVVHILPKQITKMKLRLLFLSLFLASIHFSAFSAELSEACIRVRFLGTGAADWKAPDKRGEYRRSSSILVENSVLVDFTSADMDMLPEGIRPEAVFYTHSHSDHFDPAAALQAGVRRVYVSASWVDRAKAAFRKTASSLGMKMPSVIALEVQEEVDENTLTFKALPANHSTDDLREQALIYLIEKDGIRLLYATDTGGLMSNATYGACIDVHRKECKPIHGLIMEATMSADEDFRIFAHSSVGTVLRTANVLQKTGRYAPAEGQPVYLTHLARTLHGSQAELDASLPWPLKAAYDGLEVCFKSSVVH